MGREEAGAERGSRAAGAAAGSRNLGSKKEAADPVVRAIMAREAGKPVAEIRALLDAYRFKGFVRPRRTRSASSQGTVNRSSASQRRRMAEQVVAWKAANQRARSQGTKYEADMKAALPDGARESLERRLAKGSIPRRTVAPAE